MPLYEYQCQKCGKRLEAIQKLHEETLKICPHCGGDLKKLISAPAIQFKGSGFYITDYARGSKGGGSEGESSKKSSDSGESSKKSDGDKSSGSKESGSGGTTTPKSGSES